MVSWGKRSVVVWLIFGRGKRLSDAVMLSSEIRRDLYGIAVLAAVVVVVGRFYSVYSEASSSIRLLGFSVCPYPALFQSYHQTRAERTVARNLRRSEVLP